MVRDFRVIFHAGMGFPELILELDATKSLFMQARNRAVQALNPQYEKWNEEFNANHEMVAGIESDEYITYIAGKQNAVLFPMFDGLGYRIVSMRELDTDLCMMIDGIPGYVYITLEEVNS